VSFSWKNLEKLTIMKILSVFAVRFIDGSMTYVSKGPVSPHNLFTMKVLYSVVALLAAGTAIAFAPSHLNAHRVSTKMAAAAEELYIDEERRFLMNLIMVGSGLVVVAGFGIPYIAFFVPPGAGGGAGGTTAKDALGNDLVAKDYLASKPAGDRSLAQGLKGDAT
jgi:cytochrome b6-f complex iron-sulfur subunit